MFDKFDNLQLGSSEKDHQNYAKSINNLLDDETPA